MNKGRAGLLLGRKLSEEFVAIAPSPKSGRCDTGFVQQ